MNLYEHTIIARQDTSPVELKQLTEKYSKIVEKNEGEVVKTENWGLLNLSYIIKKNRKGSYIHFKIKGKGKVIEQLEKVVDVDGSGSSTTTTTTTTGTTLSRNDIQALKILTKICSKISFLKNMFAEIISYYRP